MKKILGILMLVLVGALASCDKGEKPAPESETTTEEKLQIEDLQMKFIGGASDSKIEVNEDNKILTIEAPASSNFYDFSTLKFHCNDLELNYNLRDKDNNPIDLNVELKPGDNTFYLQVEIVCDYLIYDQIWTINIKNREIEIDVNLDNARHSYVIGGRLNLGYADVFINGEYKDQINLGEAITNKEELNTPGRHQAKFNYLDKEYSFDVISYEEIEENQIITFVGGNVLKVGDPLPRYATYYKGNEQVTIELIPEITTSFSTAEPGEHYFSIIIGNSSEAIKYMVVEEKLDYELFNFKSIYYLNSSYIEGKIRKIVNGKSELISITKDMVEGLDLTKLGEQNVVIKYENQSFNTTVTVINEYDDKLLLPKVLEVSKEYTKELLARIYSTGLIVNSPYQDSIENIKNDLTMQEINKFNNYLISLGISDEQLIKIIDFYDNELNKLLNDPSMFIGSINYSNLNKALVTLADYSSLFTDNQLAAILTGPIYRGEYYVKDYEPLLNAYKLVPLDLFLKGIGMDEVLSSSINLNKALDIKEAKRVEEFLKSLEASLAKYNKEDILNSEYYNETGRKEYHLFLNEVFADASNRDFLFSFIKEFYNNTIIIDNNINLARRESALSIIKLIEDNYDDLANILFTGDYNVSLAIDGIRGALLNARGLEKGNININSYIDILYDYLYPSILAINNSNNSLGLYNFFYNDDSKIGRIIYAFSIGIINDDKSVIKELLLNDISYALAGYSTRLIKLGSSIEDLYKSVLKDNYKEKNVLNKDEIINSLNKKGLYHLDYYTYDGVVSYSYYVYDNNNDMRIDNEAISFFQEYVIIDNGNNSYDVKKKGEQYPTGSTPEGFIKDQLKKAYIYVENDNLLIPIYTAFISLNVELVANPTNPNLILAKVGCEYATFYIPFDIVKA